MEEIFKGYFEYNGEEKENIWNTATIVMDASTLLRLYELSKKSSEEFRAILNAVKDRLWIPYQVGYEYSDNRDNVIYKSLVPIKKLKSELKSSNISIINKINDIADKEFESKQEMVGFIEKYEEDFIKLIDKEIDSKGKEHNDKIHEEILEFYSNGRMGEHYEKDIDEIKTEAKRREKEKIPPGYCDDGKGESNFGDYYIFHAMKDYASNEKTHIIFVTEDKKEDWHKKINKKIVSGRPELLSEFYKFSKQLLIINTMEDFIRNVQLNNVYKADLKDLESEVRSLGEDLSMFTAGTEWTYPSSIDEKNRDYQYHEIQRNYPNCLQNLKGLPYENDLEVLNSLYNNISELTYSDIIRMEVDLEPIRYTIDKHFALLDIGYLSSSDYERIRKYHDRMMFELKHKQFDSIMRWIMKMISIINRYVEYDQK